MITVVVDLDGVVYRGGTAIPGAGDALARLAVEHQLVFATNNSRRSPHEVAATISRVTGFEANAAMVVTSAMAAASVAEPVPTAVVGGEGIVQGLVAAGIEVVEPDAAEQIVTGIDFAFDYDMLRSAAAVIRRGCRWLATNDDATFPAEGAIWPGAGAIVAALATASGRGPNIVAGKPNQPMVDLVADRAEGEVVVIGDRPETDLALAVAAGWRSVLVLSGVTTDPEGVTPRPDAVIESLADVDDVVDGWPKR